MKKDDSFYRQLYTESGSQVRNINQLRNTYLSLFVVGVAALVALFKDDLLSPQFGYALVLLGGIGISVVWTTWQYLQKALFRQRVITELVLPDEWWEAVHPYDPPWERPRFAWLKWFREHRLDVQSLAIYLATVGVGLCIARPLAELFPDTASWSRRASCPVELLPLLGGILFFGVQAEWTARRRFVADERRLASPAT